MLGDAMSKWEEEVLVKSKGFAVLAALMLLATVAGCAAQAGSTASTPESMATTSPVATPVASTSTGVSATAEVTALATGAPAAEGTAQATVAASPAPTLQMPALSKEVESWPVLWDPEYGFDVRFPQGWFVSDVSTGDDAKPVVRAYALAPANWTETWKPIQIEVSEGTEQAFEEHYKLTGDGAKREIGPLSYNYETIGAAGATEHLAVFQSRDNAQMRVVIRDLTTGYADRTQAHTGIQGIVEQVIQSFRWRK